MKTYCNPLPLPNYPRGISATATAKARGGLLWNRSVRLDFREAADPSVLWFENSWYLYVSGTMAYVSKDFVTWQHCPINVPWIGYAPTIVEHQGKFLLTACHAPIYSAPHPLGPFESLGHPMDSLGHKIEKWADPMLFSDDDGRLFAYWGLHDGIFAMELDATNPNQGLTEPQYLFNFDPSHTWERAGEAHQFLESYVEGAWMLKVKGRYYLTYAGPGTEVTVYGMGCYVADHPLGPFTYQARNPILRDPHGLVNGPGHGCLVQGPNNTLWAFYTCLIRINHWFERRIGMDPAGFDAEGNLFVLGASESPQLAPGQIENPEQGNSAGLIPVSIHQNVRASSEAPGRDAYYAVDNYTRTWWEATAQDELPWLEISLMRPLEVSALRLLWKEPGLDYDAGTLPGPMRYKVEGRMDENEPWKILVDGTENELDLLIDYRTFSAVKIKSARLTVAGTPSGIGTGLIDFCLFGKREHIP